MDQVWCLSEWFELDYPDQMALPSIAIGNSDLLIHFEANNGVDAERCLTFMRAVVTLAKSPEHFGLDAEVVLKATDFPQTSWFSITPSKIMSVAAFALAIEASILMPGTALNRVAAMLFSSDGVSQIALADRSRADDGKPIIIDRKAITTPNQYSDTPKPSEAAKAGEAYSHGDDEIPDGTLLIMPQGVRDGSILKEDWAVMPGDIVTSGFFMSTPSTRISFIETYDGLKRAARVHPLFPVTSVHKDLLGQQVEVSMRETVPPKDSFARQFDRCLEIRCLRLRRTA
ncbi:MAG: hypothetical protein R3E21_08345 [Caenibius sp.]